MDEEAERVLLAAGFKYLEASKGYRVTPDNPKYAVESLVLVHQDKSEGNQPAQKTQ